jgi:hypothetical protein
MFQLSSAWICVCVCVYIHVHTEGRDSSVGIATRNGLDGTRIESRWGRDFPHPSRPALGPTQPPTQWVPGLSQESIGRVVALTIHPHLVPRLKKVYSYASAPLWAFVAGSRVNLP